jgi:hypothetical protein
MSISDIQNELNTIKNTIHSNDDDDDNDTNSIKTLNIKKVNSIENIELFINNKVTNIYARSWSKLEHRLKKKKIKEYFESELNNNTITQKIYQEQLDTYNKNIDLNRKFKVDYNIDKCEIISIS